MPANLRRRNALVAFARAFRPGGPGVGKQFAAIPRMVAATLRRRYDGGGRVLLMLIAALYIISPIDALPEAVLGVFGLIDDAFVTTWLVGAVLAETERFLQWERGGRVIDGRVSGRG
jgi:uncharacterized membrane protein YkvA (DUF1232 family)